MFTRLWRIFPTFSTILIFLSMVHPEQACGELVYPELVEGVEPVEGNLLSALFVLNILIWVIRICLEFRI
jgi:hypothetical protein